MEIITILVVSGIILVSIIVGYFLGKFITNKYWERNLVPEIREDAIKRSRSVLTGKFSEQLAPYLPNFPYDPTEARFIGSPIDFIVFKGNKERNTEEVIFVEVKSGNSNLSSSERKVRDAIENKKVRWEIYKIED
ncbi:MAG: Holliday junction resolvase-like protein [Candidatus Nanoarchaeia archaeon]|nr:Holliday junction resolvase-like protein [Candidatus Nanoarchaeia archaeon]